MEECVVIWALGRDGRLTCGFLADVGFTCRTCTTINEVTSLVSAGIGVLVIAAELLAPDSIANLQQILAEQPPWSDLPILIVAGEELATDRFEILASQLGNVALLHRPVVLDVLTASVRTALRARRRQYQVRDLLRQREESERRKDEFLAMLAHELRNPLAPLRTAVELLRIEAYPEQREQTRAIIQRQVATLTRLVDDLLDVSRITQGKISIRKTPVNLAEVLVQAGESVGNLIAAKQLKLEVGLPDEPLWSDADRMRLEQIVGNLLSNAMKFTPPDGVIRLSAYREKDWAVVEVQDTGIGIPDGFLQHAFEFFAQAKRTLDRSQGGLGIGLTIVRSLARLHGGDAEILSEGEGKGTTVRVLLPVLHPGWQPVPTSRSFDGLEKTTAKRVLIVEDNRDAADSLAAYLRSLGHHVTVAYDGPTGVSNARQTTPDYVVCDIGLPGMDGFQVVQTLRSDPSFSLCRFIAVTGYGDAVNHQRALHSGFDIHLTKPADPLQISRLIAFEGVDEPVRTLSTSLSEPHDVRRTHS